jgi:hypothetical protein
MFFQKESSIPTGDTLICQNPTLEIREQKMGRHKINKGKEKSDFRSQIWTLYFDASKSQEGSGAWCILIDSKGKHHFLSYRIEFECTNNTVGDMAITEG